MLFEILTKFQNGLTFENLRRFFYIVSPAETTFEKLEDVPDYLTISQYWFLAFIFVDVLIAKLLGKSVYALNDTITSVNAGILSQLPKYAGRMISIPLYVYIYNNYRLFDLDVHSTWLWFAGFFAQDLAYYLAHRVVHEAGIFWSFHQMHHSSEYYNFSTALRQGFIQEIGTSTCECLQSIFIPPPLFLVHKRLNTLYQFWIHNDFIPKLGPLELIFNTPSHHRVHHGRNPYCIDKNYAGVLIIWDKIFGTFELERENEKPIYGLVTNVKSFNQLWLQLFEFKELGYDKGQMKDENGKELFPGFIGKLKACFGPPGFFPGVKTKQFFWWRCMNDPTEGIPEIEKDVKVYNPPLNLVETLYTTFIFISGLVAANQLAFDGSKMPWSTYFAYLAFIVGTLQIVGYYLDKDTVASQLDLIRLIIIGAYGLTTGNLQLCTFAGLSAVFVLYFFQNSKSNGKSKLT